MEEYTQNKNLEKKSTGTHTTIEINVWHRNMVFVEIK